MKITPDVFEAYLKCPTKCWLRATSEPCDGNTYTKWVKAQIDSYHTTETKRLVAASPNDEVARSPDTENVKAAKWRLACSLAVQAQMDSCVLESELHAVERVPAEGRGKPAQFIPVRFVFTNKLGKDEKLLLAFDAFALSKSMGGEISLGKIIHGDDHATLKVKISALASEVRKRIEKIAVLLSSPAPPDLVLNRHCAECEFQVRCRQKAVEKDDLSLLSNMREKERKKLRSKGIFTVTQLSYTFRPRRRPKKLRDKREKYHHSLKALAIREKKIYIVGSPELKIEGTPVYLDVEGLPDCDFYYLIGMRIGDGESAVQHSLWADTVQEEGKIWTEFLGILETVEKPVLVHYGSYETTFLKRMSDRYAGPPDGSVVARAIGSTVNLLSGIFAQIYFPTYSNGLKEITASLGFEWPGPVASGTQAITWKHEWERSGEPQTKAELVAYNSRDCEAVEQVARTIGRLGLPTARLEDGTREELVVFTDSLVGKQTLFPRFKSSVADLELINKAAHWNYQRDRIYVRANERIRRAQRRENVHKLPPAPNKVVVIANPPRCPKCDLSTKLHSAPASTLHDVHFGRFGIKRWVVRYEYCRGWCPSCHGYFGRPSEFWGQSKYGRNLVALVVFKIVGLCMPQHTVTASLNKLLGFRLPECSVNNLKASAARYYSETKDSILKQMLTGNLIHADETRVSVKGKTAYVWVLASLDSVVYLHTETREGERVEAALSGFRGVLVSDFYAVYDSFACPQQKCLIHLVRDMNEELLNYPYDSALKETVTAFANLLKPMIETVDRHGLKRRFLRKHRLFVKRFYRQLSKTHCNSEAATKCKQRLEKNRENLFTFLDHDGVPWNNNNAEHAIKAFARLRRVIEGLSTPKGIEEYLTLLSVCQTCKYMGVDFLDFLRSGEKDVHAFAESRRGHRRRLPTMVPKALPGAQHAGPATCATPVT